MDILFDFFEIFFNPLSISNFSKFFLRLPLGPLSNLLFFEYADIFLIGK